MKNSILEKDFKKIDNVRNLFRLKKKIADTTIKDARSLLRLKKYMTPQLKI